MHPLLPRVGRLVLVGLMSAASAEAAELQPRTVAAFDRYVAATEAEREGGAFLWVDGRDAGARALLRKGDLLIESLQTRISNRSIPVPDGLVHHWLGAVYVPGATLDAAVRLLQDYDHHASIFGPNVARSSLLLHQGDTFRVFLRFVMKKAITVVVNSEHEAQFMRVSATQARSRIVSTRIAEVANPGTPQERENPVGRDGGYLWRLNSYWRLEQRDGGVYVQCESISLTRGIPYGVGWLVRPFVTSIPRETLTFTLEKTRGALVAR